MSEVAAGRIARFTLLFPLGKQKIRLCCSNWRLPAPAYARHPALLLPGLSSPIKREAQMARLSFLQSKNIIQTKPKTVNFAGFEYIVLEAPLLL